MRLYQHPTQPGWLIGTAEIERLLNVDYLIVLPDGAQVHPLYFQPVDFGPEDLAGAQDYAKQFVRVYALAKMALLDSDLNWGNVGTNLVMGEAERFLLAGRPANPALAQYAIAEKWRVRRGETLAATLNWMADKYLVMYGEAANIIDLWNEKIAAIEAAVTVEDVAAVLASLP